MPDRGRNSPNDNDDTPMATTAEVAAVVNTVQRRHRDRIRWSLGRHTAEMALRAIDGSAPKPRRSSSKSRRRKRHKRFL